MNAHTYNWWHDVVDLKCSNRTARRCVRPSGIYWRRARYLTLVDLPNEVTWLAVIAVECVMLPEHLRRGSVVESADIIFGESTTVPDDSQKEPVVARLWYDVWRGWQSGQLVIGVYLDRVVGKRCHSRSRRSGCCIEAIQRHNWHKVVRWFNKLF